MAVSIKSERRALVVLLKEIDTNHGTSRVSCTYTPSIETYNIVTDNMTDDCIPTQLGNGCCIWLNGNLERLNVFVQRISKMEFQHIFILTNGLKVHLLSRYLQLMMM